jgi:hypothetical protein
MHDLAFAVSPVISSRIFALPAREEVFSKCTPVVTPRMEAAAGVQVVVDTSTPARSTRVQVPVVPPLLSLTPTASTASAGFSVDMISKLLKLLPDSSDEDDD